MRPYHLLLGCLLGGLSFGVLANIPTDSCPLLSSSATAPESLRHYQHLSVLIETPYGSGTGVLVHRDSGVYVWTAAHVVTPYGPWGEPLPVDPDLPVTVEHRDWKADARIVAVSDDYHDVALLAVTGPFPCPGGTRFLLQEDPLPVGTELVHVGCLQGRSGLLSVTTGIVSFTGRNYSFGCFDQITCDAQPGSSGGGVWDRETGQCIGLLVAGGGPGFNLIIPARVIREWAKGAGVEWAVDPSLPEPPTLQDVVVSPS